MIWDKLKVFWTLRNNLKNIAPQRPLPSLAACLLMDAIGYASFLLPGIGEVADLAWAPISAMIFFKMFGGTRGLFGGLFNFVEELLPGLDFIPTFTLTWFLLSWQQRKTPQAANIISVKAR